MAAAITPQRKVAIPGRTRHESGAMTPRSVALLILLCSLAAGPVPATEVQRHGLAFEEWVRVTFFSGYRPSDYTQRWDIPAAANTRHGGVPVNPKAAKYGGPVDLGDALRQFDIDEPFLLVIGYWRQEGPAKRFVNIVAPRIEPEVWRRLWGPVTRVDLERLDALVKDRSLDYREVRRRALAIKNAPPFSEATMALNPKIDSRGQRRLQCSLRFADVFKYLTPDSPSDELPRPALWGVEFPGPIASPPRSAAP